MCLVFYPTTAFKDLFPLYMHMRTVLGTSVRDTCLVNSFVVHTQWETQSITDT